MISIPNYPQHPPVSDPWSSNANANRISARTAEYRAFTETLEIERNEYEAMMNRALHAF